MISRSIDKAREAFKKRDLKALKESHKVHAPEPHTTSTGQYIKSIIYGGLDGIITTFAVVAGVAGASLSAGIVLILGFTNLIADGISMAIGDYLSTKAENEYNQTERARETWEVENYPEGERQELVELYMTKGIAETDAKTMVNIIAKNKKAWIDIMMVEELGIVESNESPVKNAIVTFLSFVFFGFIPLVIYIGNYFLNYGGKSTFAIASVLTAFTLFALGALKVRITDRNWFFSGIEMLMVGGTAALAAYAIGDHFRVWHKRRL